MTITNRESPGVVVRRLAANLAEQRQPTSKLFIVPLLSNAFASSGWSLLDSEAKAEEWAPRFESLFETSLSDVWESEGVAPPLHSAPSAPRMYVGTGHPQYLGEFNANCFLVLDLILNCNDQQLNGIVACTLSAIGFERVFIVDGPNDAGVDVIGFWPSGALRGVCACVQSKAWSGRLSGQHVEEVVLKYRDGLSSKDIWKTYRGSFGGHEAPGVGHLFVIASREGFSPSGLESARLKGALCWGPRKISQTLGSRFPASLLEKALSELGAQKREISRNVVGLINQLREDSL